ncbi:hypothetical protein CG710_007290 [Lachnotalea glycerini]|uniref:Uncharacterized protein n=1 Tax=Lachnotalea glycerini TaxID=1763509 RepID=A0A371JGS1_9FIRM|nr:hypothetical protein CG710_007290 [Lachnotalea glycerini]
MGDRAGSIPVIRSTKGFKTLKKVLRLFFCAYYCNDLGMVFFGVDGNYIYPRIFLRQYKVLLQKVGIEIKRYHCKFKRNIRRREYYWHI